VETVSLREYLEALSREQDLRYQQRFDAQNKAIDAALASAEKAVTKAEAASEKRFEASNEVRGAMDDLTRTMMPRSEAQVGLNALREKVDELQKKIVASEASQTGRASQWVLIAGAIFLVIAIAGFVLPYLNKG